MTVFNFLIISIIISETKVDLQHPSPLASSTDFPGMAAVESPYCQTSFLLIRFSTSTI